MTTSSPPTTASRANMKAATVAAAAVLSLALSSAPACAFAPSPQIAIRQSLDTTLNSDPTVRPVSSRLRMNIPAPTIEGGATPDELKSFADSASPPASFFELQRASVRAAEMAIDDGHRLLEVEFPPLPANVLEMDDVSAYDVAKANVNLALDFAKSFANTDRVDGVAIMLPDESEKQIMLEDLTLEEKVYPGVTLTSLRRGVEGDTRVFKPEDLLVGLMGRGSGGTVRAVEGADMYVIVVASAQELPDVEELYELTKAEEGKKSPVIVFYNLKLDVLRGDLGAPAFPGKDFQDRFLSRVKPVYYLRTRQYSRSVSAPPFIVNFQGCIFRSYPGHYQTLLDTGTGRYRKVVGNDVRPALGEFKEQLTDALREEGVIASKEEEGGLFGFLRTGYKTTTWWEDEREDASLEWRT